jgi:TRAP transporter TAXI family solute receptor
MSCKSFVVVLAALTILSLSAAPGQAQAQRQDILILGATSGGSAHTISCGLAELISKGNFSLRASCQETFGSADNIRKLSGKPNMIGVAADLSYWLALAGEKPFDKKFANLRAVGLNSVYGYTFLTINPKIKKKEDLVGRKIAVGKSASAVFDLSKLILDNTWGIWDKVEKQFIDWSAGSAALQDGLIDAMLVIVGISADENGKPKWTEHPSFGEIVSLREVNFIGPTQEEVQASAAKTGYVLSHFTVPAGAVGKNQKEAFSVMGGVMPFWADASMPDETAYEFVRAQYEQHKEWGGYHAQVKFIGPKTIGFAPVKTEAEFHPGALKFFKEKKVPLFINGQAPPFE